MLMAGSKRLHMRRHAALIARIATVTVLFLVLYAAVPQLAFFNGAREALRSLQPLWLAAAGAAFLGTYITAALMYACLSRRHIPMGKTLLVQIAAAFAGRLLPAGSGAVAVSYGYLRQRRYDGPEAAGIIAMNNLLGVVGHVCIIILALILDPDVLHLVRVPVPSWGVGAAAIVIAAAGILFWHWRRRTVRFIGAMLHDLTQYEHHPGRLVLAFSVSVSLTLLYALAFYCCVRACGLHLSGTAVLVVFTFSVLAGAITPSPGGAGGVEAALVGGLAGFGLSPATALAITLSYRLITFWLALLVGVPAFVLALRLRLLAARL